MGGHYGLKHTYMKLAYIFLLSVMTFSCHAQDIDEKLPQTNPPSSDSIPTIEEKKEIAPQLVKPQDRKEIVDRLKTKLEKGDDVVIHVMVPLCDNKHQGIVPVNDRLGNGMNLQTNLYWGAGYGIKSHFYYHTNWKLTKSTKHVNDDVLERVIFKKKKGSATVYLVADAYRGDRMKACLEDYFSSLAGELNDTVHIDTHVIDVYAAADLVVFNGHNGLMDITVPIVEKDSGSPKEAIAIACASQAYFEPYLAAAKAYPLVMTTHLLAPEAYVIEDIIEAWLNLKTGEEIRLAAGDAYHRIQKCGQTGARKLFSTGWKY